MSQSCWVKWMMFITSGTVGVFTEHVAERNIEQGKPRDRVGLFLPGWEAAVKFQSLTSWAVSAFPAPRALPVLSRGALQSQTWGQSHSCSVLNLDHQALIVATPQRHVPLMGKTSLGMIMGGRPFSQPPYSFYTNREMQSGDCNPLSN